MSARTRFVQNIFGILAVLFADGFLVAERFTEWFSCHWSSLGQSLDICFALVTHRSFMDLGGSDKLKRQVNGSYVACIALNVIWQFIQIGTRIT